MEERAGGKGSMAGGLGEDVIRSALLFVLNAKALRLQIEHGSVTPGQRQQFVVRTKLDNVPLFKHANAIGLPNGGETMRDEDGGAMPGSG
jgi:hypothetical protein